MNIQYTIDTPINQFRADVTGEMLRSAIALLRSDSPLLANAQDFVDSARANNIDQLYLCAHAILESAWGASYYAINRHNLYGYQAYDSDPDKAGYFASNAACIAFIAKFVATAYLSPSGQWYGGAPSLRGMNVKYATASHWGTSIAQIMNQLESKMNFAPMPQPSVTAFNRTAQVTADNGVNVRSFPTTTSSVLRSIPHGQTLSIDGYATGDNISGNTYWLRLKGENSFIWSGATNLSDVPAQLTPPSPSPTPLVVSPAVAVATQDLQNQIDQLKQQLQQALTDKTQAATDKQSLQQKIDELTNQCEKLQQVASNADGAAKLNEVYEGQIEAYKTKVGQLNGDLKNAYASAFKQWSLTYVPAGRSGLTKLPLLLLSTLKVGLLARNHSFVVGYKQDAKLYLANDPTVEISTLQADTK